MSRLRVRQAQFLGLAIRIRINDPPSPLSSPLSPRILFFFFSLSLSLSLFLSLLPIVSVLWKWMVSRSLEFRQTEYLYQNKYKVTPFLIWFDDMLSSNVKTSLTGDLRAQSDQLNKWQPVSPPHMRYI